jgi:hypothetical protein
MSVDGRSPTETLAGLLRLRIVSDEARFIVPDPDGGDRHPREFEAGPEAAILGSGNDVDIQLDSPGAHGVSRRHLLLQPAGRQWIVIDCSKNGTRELLESDGRQEWRRVQPDLPVPVVPAIRLKLGPELELELTPIRQPVPGSTTATDDSAGSTGSRVPSLELEQVARALLASRRSGSVAVAPLPVVAAGLHMSDKSLYRKLRLLAELPAVKPFLADKPQVRGGRRPQDVADALAKAFPYLLASAG